MGKIIIDAQTPKNPITLAGRMAGVAYGSDTTDFQKNFNRGINCIEAGHGRLLEFADVYMTIDGYSARVIRQLYTHIGGSPTRVQSSTRYVNYSNFDYIIPPKINKDYYGARDRYICAMEDIQCAVVDLMDTYRIPKEDAANLLPLGMTTTVSCKYNARTLMTMAEQRKCSRAYWEFRQLMDDIEEALRDYSPEWDFLCDIIMQCKCDKAGYCLEEYSCGKYPKKVDK